MTLRRFEELSGIWDSGLRGQIRRAALSTMANIVEGFHRRSDREFAQFLFTAKASLAEVQSHLYVAMDQRYLDDREFRNLFDQAEDIARQISGLISHLNRHA